MNRREWIKSMGILGAGLGMGGLRAARWLPQSGLSRADFGPGFHWGVATAAYQIEGAWQADGKGPSVWDHFAHRRGKIKTGENADVSCDFYHRFEGDLEILRQMGVPNFRFSTAWSRIFPAGTGPLNDAGLDFYDRVVDTCLEKGIAPWVTLYHWDLPQALEEKGGWRNRDVLGWFAQYADTVTRRLGDRVKDWMVLNEPMAFVGLGYFLGMHAPGKRGPYKFLAATHHASMAQASGARIIRANVTDAHIGSTFSCSHIIPKSDKPKHVRAATRMDALMNRLFLEPALGMGYPVDDLPFLKRMERYIQPGDLDELRADLDFVGLQNYTREVVKKSIVPFIRAIYVKPEKRGIPEEHITEMGWEVYPEGIYHLLKKFAAYPQIRKIIVTENGASFPDQVVQGRVHDDRRTAYLQNYLGQVLRAQQEGVPVSGYFVWTFLDNFEWAEGYHPRFGLVHVDFATQERIVKDSGRWYGDFLKGK